MKFATIALAFAAVTQALTIRQEAAEPEQPPMDFESEERTIVGFLFKGFDFGELWVNLTDDQREEIKQSVFEQTVELAGFNPEEYPEMDFEFAEGEYESLAPGEGAEPIETEEGEDETTLAQCGGWGCGGCCRPRCWRPCYHGHCHHHFHHHCCHRPCCGGCRNFWW